jgi:hypothetical protein
MASAARKHFAVRCDAISYSRYWILTPTDATTRIATMSSCHRDPRIDFRSLGDSPASMTSVPHKEQESCSTCTMLRVIHSLVIISSR